MIQLTVNRGGSALDWTHTQHETLQDAFAHIPTDLGTEDTVIIMETLNIEFLYVLKRVI